MIELRGVHFRYNERPVLRNVSFVVQEDESLVVMGPSGSGKSTILRLILGLENAQQGEVLIDGHDVCTMSEKQKRNIRKNIGMVFQDGALFDSLTVGENVAYYLIEHTRMKWSEIVMKAKEMLGFVGLDPDEIMDRLPEELSGGMQRRVAIGRALLSTNPRIMLYDEPTTGLDPHSSENMLNLIMKLSQKTSNSTIVVTHQIADAFTVADHFVVIYDGEVALDGDLEHLRTSRDHRVLEFLRPFRKSMVEVFKKKVLDDVPDMI